MYRLRTFGGLSIADERGLLTGAPTQRRRLALLALLAAGGERGISREKLAAYFWPESDEESARHGLRQLLSITRRDLNEEELFLGATDIRLNESRMSSDVAEFESAIARGELERAAELHTAPFLDGFFLSGSAEFGRWIEDERARLTQELEGALETLADRAATRGDQREAIQWWRRLAATDPLRSRYAVGLISALASAGDCAGALQQARVHEALVRDQLAAEPEPALRELVTRLRQGDWPRAPMVAPHPQRGEPDPDAHPLRAGAGPHPKPAGGRQRPRGRLLDRPHRQRGDDLQHAARWQHGAV